jgi:hypothetical protein
MDLNDQKKIHYHIKVYDLNDLGKEDVINLYDNNKLEERKTPLSSNL